MRPGADCSLLFTQRHTSGASEPCTDMRNGRLYRVLCLCSFARTNKRGIMLDNWTVQGLTTVVLVVDQDVLQRVEEGAELRREGFHVVEAATVTEAITVLQSRAVDIVLSQLDLGGSET